MTERLRYVLEASPLSWGTLFAVMLAVASGVYGYGQLEQRVAVLEELRPLQVAAKLATIEAYQARTLTDLSRVQQDIAELRRELGSPRQWDQQRYRPQPQTDHPR